MKHISAIAFGVLLSASVTPCFPASDDGIPVSGASSFYLNDADLASSKEKALGGDARAAYRVYQHYSVGMGDAISAFPWLQMAASRNDSQAQYAMGYTCIYVDVFRNVPLAKFWLNEASKNGVIEAEDLLKRIENQNNSKK